VSGSILIIQTASLGDVILSTALAETIRRHRPGTAIDYLVKKGSETLFSGHPFVRNVLVWDKKGSKYGNLLTLAAIVRKNRYSEIINVQRFASSGFLTAVSGAPVKSGFGKNPLSFFFNRIAEHSIADNNGGIHEITRNHALIRHLNIEKPERPRLYPTATDYETAGHWGKGTYITISPASLWFTKQLPTHKWIGLCDVLSSKINIVLLGSEADKMLCADIAYRSKRNDIINLAGVLSMLQSAALMEGAIMNYVNDSAPMHLASSVNAPVAAVYCSTIPAFGFGPLSDVSHIVEATESPDCRPCGLHGHKSCPMGHFECAEKIEIQQLINVLPTNG
jgi:heptosyltransferase-2